MLTMKELRLIILGKYIFEPISEYFMNGSLFLKSVFTTRFKCGQFSIQSLIYIYRSDANYQLLISDADYHLLKSDA